MTGEANESYVVYKDDPAVRALLIGFGGFTVGAGIYYGTEFLPFEEEVANATYEAARLESEANAMLFTRDHLGGKEMLTFGQDFYLTETAGSMLMNATVIREQTPNEVVGQLKIVGAGLVTGILAAAVFLAGHDLKYRNKKRRHEKRTEELVYQAEAVKKLLEDRKVAAQHQPNDPDDDFTPPSAA